MQYLISAFGFIFCIILGAVTGVIVLEGLAIMMEWPHHTGLILLLLVAIGLWLWSLYGE